LPPGFVLAPPAGDVLASRVGRAGALAPCLL
jgi:hypothetical protein